MNTKNEILYGFKYNQDLETLRKLKAKAPKAYKEFMLKMSNQYSLSVKTIYRHLSLAKPVTRKTRSDKNLKKNDYSISMKPLKDSETPKVVNPDKSDFSKFLSKLFDVNDVGLKNGVKIKFRKVTFFIPPEDVNDILLIIHNAYNRFIENPADMVSFDRELLRRSMISHLIENQIRIAKDKGDYKMIESITRMQDRLETDTSLNTDFAVFEKCLRHVKPDITKSECVSLIKKYSLPE